jgi:FeS assembly SUF system regulator
MIRLTKQTDYGIVLLTHMAKQPGRVFNAPELAVENHLPAPMASKILKILARDGLLTSHRGVKGGYTLGRAAKEISLAAIVAALEGPIGLTECIDEVSGSCTCEPVCGVRDNWRRINLAVRRALESIDLEEMTRPLSDGPTWLEKPEELVTLRGGASRAGA